MAKDTNSLAVAGFIVALCGFLLPYGLVGLAGFIMSLVGFNTNKAQRGLAIAGISLGAFSILKILFWTVWILAVV